MCIIYRKDTTERLKQSTSPFTVYKVYFVKNKKLLSIYYGNYSTMPWGTSIGGDIIAHNSFVSKGQEYIGALLSSLTARTLVTAPVDGDRLDAWGIHCFLNREDAVAYLADLSLKHLTIVELTALPEDVIIGGYEKIWIDPDTDKNLHTATFKKVTISQTEFEKAINTCA